MSLPPGCRSVNPVPPVVTMSRNSATVALPSGAIFPATAIKHATSMPASKRMPRHLCRPGQLDLRDDVESDDLLPGVSPQPVTIWRHGRNRQALLRKVGGSEVVIKERNIEHAGVAKSVAKSASCGPTASAANRKRR